MTDESNHIYSLTSVVSRAVTYLEPFVVAEEAEWYQRVTHEEPVNKLLDYINERVECAVGHFCQQGTVPH